MSIQKSQFITAAVLLFGSQLLHAQLNDFVPLSDDALNNPDAADWLRWRGNHSANGYSSLDQLTPENAHKLRLAWAWNMESGESEQEPLVYDGIMFLPHTNGKVQALDATDGELIWEYKRRLPPGMQNATTRFSLPSTQRPGSAPGRFEPATRTTG